MTPSDFRNFHRMLSCIRSLKSGVVGLVDGAEGLLFLRSSLDIIKEAWDNVFTSHVATLESAGLATEQQKTTMGATYDATVATALDELEALVLSQIPADTTFSEDDSGSSVPFRNGCQEI